MNFLLRIIYLLLFACHKAMRGAGPVPPVSEGSSWKPGSGRRASAFTGLAVALLAPLLALLFFRRNRKSKGAGKVSEFVYEGFTD